MRVAVAVATAAVQEVEELELPEGATVADALAAAGVASRHPALPLDRVGVWGRRREAGWPLRDGDRVEVYRPVSADAKALRRKRAGLSSSTRSRSAP